VFTWSLSEARIGNCKKQLLPFEVEKQREKGEDSNLHLFGGQRQQLWAEKGGQ
jgi:hypothetical protein